MKPDRHSIRSLAAHWMNRGADLALAILFWFVLVILAIVATAQSEKPWDTVIAALAMGSQAFFAAAVWKLGKSQFAFTRQVSERQHKIDMYPLRKAATLDLEEAAMVLMTPPSLTDDSAEAFRLCHLEIENLFSDEADELAYELYRLVEQAHILFLQAQPRYDAGGSITELANAEKTATAHNSLDNAYDVLTDLQNIIDEEMRIH